MLPTELEKMNAGDWYSCLDDELEVFRAVARTAVYEHNNFIPAKRGSMSASLRSLLGSVGPDVFLEAPFHCSYGFNIHLAEGVYLNTGCVILDSAPVHIGRRSLLGPGVQIYCADHHRERKKRAAGIEKARSVNIGSDVWIGGASILLPGISVGDGSIIGAGSVVTRDVPKCGRVAGNPARSIAQS